MEEDTDVPQERDTKDFQFKQLKKLRIFNTPADLPKARSNLLAISNKHGFLFLGSSSGLKIFSTKDLLIPVKTGEDPNCIFASPPGIDVPTAFPVHHVALSSDSLTLSVCMSSDSGCIISFYDTRTLVNKAKQPKQAFSSMLLQRDAGSFVADLKWNPVASNVAICLSDGSISVLQVTETISLYANLPSAVGVTSVCWSPKGKQLAVGKQNGTVVQYLPNLQEKKVIPCPSFYDSDNPVKVLDVLWISTYVFAVVYAAADGSVETSPQLVMVLLPKKEERRGERFLNFTETCYCSINNERQHHFFMNYVEDWEVLLGASAASIEVSVIARVADQNTWELWVLEDSGRAELPLTDSSEDTLPMGVVVDYSSQLETAISEEKILPPTPILLILSTDGVLCPFHVINLLPGAKSLTTPPEELSMEGERQPRSAASVPTQAAAPPPYAPPAVTPAFSVPISSLSAKTQPAPPAFSLPAATTKLVPASSGFTAPTAPVFASKPQAASPIFAPPAASFGSKPQTTSQGFSAPPGSFPTKPQAAVQGFGASPSGLPSKPQGTFNLPASFGKPQESAAGFSFGAGPSPALGGIAGTSSTPSSAQGFSFAKQPTPVFGTPSSKPEVPTGAPQAANPSFGFSSTNVKMNLSDQFSAVESAAPKPAFAPPPTTQTFPFAPPAKSTVTAAAPISAQPAPPPSQATAPPSRPFPEALPQATPPAAAQKTPKVALPPEYKPPPTQPPQPPATNPILNAIKEEIAHFQKEMDDLKAHTAKASFSVGSDEEKRHLKMECDELQSFMLEIKETTESLHGDVGILKTSLRDAFSNVIDAKELNERKKDPTYRRLLSTRPLDPKSEAQMQEIRRLHQYVNFKVQDVNDVLDFEWNQYLENRRKQRGLAVPQRETLFNTLANNQEIINQEKRRLNQLIGNMQKLGLYNQTSQWRIEEDSANRSFEEDLEKLQKDLSKTALETESKPSKISPTKISPAKMLQLKNFLSKRKPPTIRSLAPANLSRSAFLAPSFFEDLDDVSSTSSLSEAADNEDGLISAQQEASRQETPPPEPSPVRPARHAPVTRTVSVQPGFGTPSIPFGKAQTQGGPVTSTPAVPAQPIRVIPQGADSTMLATKTVKHGAPTVTATQQAAQAALRRQMTNQAPASLTESTLQTVPQVVNVKELKGNGPGPTIPTVIGPSVPQSAAQVVNQVLVTVGSAPAKQIASAGGLKAPLSPGPNNTPVQLASGLPANKIAGQAIPKSEAPAATSSVVPANKTFPFSAPGGVFSMGSVAPSSAPSPALGSTQVKELSQPSSFMSDPAAKFQFGQFGSPKPAAAVTTTALTAVSTDSMSAKTPSAQTPPPISTVPISAGSAAKPMDGATQSFTSGETLGSFSGLRVGQAEEVPKTEPPKVTPLLQPVKPPGLSPVVSIGGFQPSKPSEPASAASSSSGLVFGNMKFPSTTISGIFNPSGPKQSFSFAPQSTTTPGLEASSTAPAPLSFGGFIAPLASAVPSATTVAAATSTTAGVISASVDVKQMESEKLTNEPTAPPSQLQALLAAPTEGSKELIAALSLSTTGRTVPSVPVAVTTGAKSQPATETKPGTPPASIFPAAAITGLNVPVTSTTPVSASPLPAPASTASEGPPSQPPLLVTSTPSLGQANTQVTSAPAESTATVSAFGQPPVAATPAPSTTATPVFGQVSAAGTVTPAFGQPASTTSTSGNTASAFGTSVFGTANSSGGFGQPAFGQTTSFWKTPASSASSFSFAQSGFGSQPVFGQPATSTAAASSAGSGSLFGSSANTNSASTFSFRLPSSPSNTPTSGGGGLFGQSSAPAFGQTSTFGQGNSVFGSAGAATTTTSSSAFGFGQSGFGASAPGSVFGQPQNSGTGVFGQASSTGGLFGASSGSTAGGGFFSGLGGKPSQEAANKNPFGAAGTAFGASGSPNNPNLFGNSGAKSFGFGSSTFGEQKTTTGTFSAGGSVASQGFGFSSPTKTGGFGAAPVFGSPPTFGGSPGFGGVPAFGSAPTFASPLGSTGGKVFGEGTAAANTGGFGFGNSSGTTFGSLASQNTPTFGSLSQQPTGFGGQSSGFSGFGSSSGGAPTGSSSGFSFGTPNQSASGFGGGWRG
ncbi:nuclear pore complex protein Nup214 isoform X2 [Hyperolius riggenbachi]|uniref:nuclear pore complex protein Nup214 isoform X2 n=1 Tax=Hyperolius riggenbachi TaxID=752182 RepID=UPI0035A31BC6